MAIYKELEDIISSVTTGETPELNLDRLLELEKEKIRTQKRLETLTARLQADCKAAKEKLATQDKERATVKKELTKLKEDDAVVSKKLMKLESEIKDLKYKITRSNQISSITQKEKDILNKNQDELWAYKALTGIRFSFQTPDNVVEGLITNSANNFIKSFTLEKSLSKKCKETLWKLVGEAASESWLKTDCNKENEIK